MDMRLKILEFYNGQSIELNWKFHDAMDLESWALVLGPFGVEIVDSYDMEWFGVFLQFFLSNPNSWFMVMDVLLVFR